MGINVLSLFDGISCGRVALERANIEVNNYYTSEIDKYAELISKYNYPNTIRLGDINNWENWNIDFSSIDLLLAGFPCQSWSIAGNQKGDKDPRGKLMWVMLDILHFIEKLNSNVKFLFENVKPKKELLNYINNSIGVDGILINSALVSAQNRKRLYWTNIKNIKQPKDKKIYLKDILQEGEVDRDKSYCIDANYYKSGNLKQYFKKCRRQLVFNKPIRIGIIGKGGQGQRIYDINAKSVTLSALDGGQGAKTGLYAIDNKNTSVRKLTPIECERLQTLDDNYTKFGIDKNNKVVEISNTRRYMALGNGWTVDVITHILKNLKGELI